MYMVGRDQPLLDNHAWVGSCRVKSTGSYGSSFTVEDTGRSFFLPSHKTHRAPLLFVFFLSQTPVYTAKPRIGYLDSASRGVRVYAPAFAGTHCAYPQRDDQTKLTWMSWLHTKTCTRERYPSHY